MMRAQWMNKTLLAVSIQIFMMGGVYAADVKAEDVPTASKPATAFTEPDPNATAVQPEDAPAIEPAPVAPSHTAQTVQSNGAAEALQKQEGDATQESNLQEVFTSNERQYSLIKRGEISTYYDIDYTYYRDSQLNLAIQDGSVAQLRVDEDATHTLTNTFTLQYGLRDNLTLSTSLPFVAKSDNLKDTTTAGLGDISFGASLGTVSFKSRSFTSDFIW